MSCRRCASSPGPTPFSTASGSSPPATPTSSATGGSSPGSDSPPRAMKRVASALETELARLAQLELRRSRTTVEAFPASDTRAVALRGGRRLVDFLSNDYLGLARHPALAAAMSACAARTGAGSGASHLITGHGAEHELLEEELAAFTHRERALVFSTGYMANLAVLATLAGRGERVLLDRLSHASLIDGARLSGAELRRYPHADAGAAARLLARDPGRTALLGTDGVFSMDGDLAPLADSPTPIQPVLFGSAAAALAAQRELEEAGFWVVAIRPPTVPPGSSRLRVTLSATHTEAEVDELVGRLARCCSALARSALA